MAMNTTSLNISDEAPEIVYPEPLTFDDCAAACELLLKKMKELSDSLKSKYRLECLPSKGLWQLRVKLDSVAWYDHWVNQGEEKDIATKARVEKEIATKAQAYVKKTQDKLAEVQEVVDSDYDLVIPGEYCFKVGCIYTNGCRNGKHIKLCTKSIVRADGSIFRCPFAVIDEFLIKAEDFKFPDFKVSVKRNPARQIMLTPEKHVSNCDLVKDVNTWVCIKDIYAKLIAVCVPQNSTCVLEGIAINFGKWETANSKDKSEFAQDCHGHIHMHLSRFAVDILENTAGWDAIRGRVQHPENYLEKDIETLIVCRLNTAFHSNITNELNAVKKDVTVLGEKFDAVQKDVGEKFDNIEKMINAIMLEFKK